ncbi:MULTISPECIES: membrane protein [unclassified Streptomyces]|uniref:membrane protein n=1 Tax=unclassified Streptomyces TaxID=2593676 RepID=UPI00036E02B2|nr:membrane protein [Streptomyces sp. 303MFCol5.2]
MARRPLPSILSTGSAQIARSRELARTAADSATDVLHPLITITRGLRRLASAGRRRWAETPKDKRGPLLFLAASLILVVVLVPYGPLLAVITLMAAAAWQGRDRTPPAPEGPDESQIQRLQVLYEALVPYFSTADDPAPLYAHGGDWETVFPTQEFDDSGRVALLVIRYPAFFPDGEAAPRARIEQLLAAKSGRGREYLFLWDEEGNELTLSVLSPLPTDFAAQRFVTAPGETVLGFTDPSRVQRTLPLAHGEDRRDVPPVVWRTGIRSTEPHLLAVGQPGSGTSTLLRSIALQALQHGDVLVIEGGSTGEYACLTGRDGVLGVEVGLAGALAALEWAVHETERRLIAANRARQAGDPPPDDTRHPLWILLDRPTAFTHLADTDGRKDPQSLLQVPLRHGRAVGVTVVVAEQFDALDSLSDAVRQHTRARVALGPASKQQLEAVLGAPPHTTPVDHTPPGRGYARLGSGPVHRLQVPATPDPYDDATSDAHRQAVLDLLPPRSTPADTEALPPVPAEVALAEPVDKPVDTDAAATKATGAEPVAADAVGAEQVSSAGG